MDSYTVSPVKEHSSTLILLHETHSNGKKLYELLKNALHPITIKVALPHTKLIFPHGPLRVLHGDEADLRSWFILGEDSSGATDQVWKGINNTSSELCKIIDQEAAAVGRQNVFIGGHGMGCAAGLALLLYMAYPVGGFFGASGFMPFTGDITIRAEIGQINTGTPETYDGDFDLSQFLDPSLWGEASRTNNSQTPQQPPSFTLTKDCEDRLLRVVTFLRTLTDDATRRDTLPQINAVATPVILAHTTRDPFIPIDHAEEALKLLGRLGFKVTLKKLDRNEHEVTPHMLEAFLTTFYKLRQRG